jgi:hypothetical protein
MAAMIITPLATEAHETSKVARIAVLLTRYPSHADPPQAFRKRLREFGYILARPGGNVTGIALMHPEVSAKRLQLCCGTGPRPGTEPC